MDLYVPLQTLELIIIAVITFFSKVGMITFQDFMEDFFIFGNEQVVFNFKMFDYLFCERRSLTQICLLTIETCTLYASRRNVENAVLATCSIEFNIYTFDENFQCGLSSAVK